MKKINIVMMLIFVLFIASCSSDNINVKSIPALIKEGFISDTEYEIVCMGLPKPGLTGFQKEESAKRAALLNAYFFTRNRFDDTVSPDKDGEIADFSMVDDHGELRYIIRKSNLKKRMKKED